MRTRYWTILLIALLVFCGIVLFLYFMHLGPWILGLAIGLAVVLFLLLAVFLWAILDIQTTEKQRKERTYVRWREKVLGLRATTSGPDVAGILVENNKRGFRTAVAAIAHGNTYFRWGSHWKQCVTSECPSAVRLLEDAAECLDLMSETEEFPVPPDSFVRFYVVASGSVFTAEARLRELEEDQVSLLSRLYAQGNAVAGHRHGNW